MCVKQWRAAGKDAKISGFSDPVISKGRVIVDLIDAIKPGSVKYDVLKAGDNDEVCLSIYSSSSSLSVCLLSACTTAHLTLDNHSLCTSSVSSSSSSFK